MLNPFWNSSSSSVIHLQLFHFRNSPSRIPLPKFLFQSSLQEFPPLIPFTLSTSESTVDFTMSLITDLPFLQSFKPHYIHSRPPDVIKFTYSTVRYGKHPAYLRVASKDRLLPVFYLYDSYRCPTSFDAMIYISPIHTLVLFIDSSVSVVVSGLALPESKGR